LQTARCRLLADAVSVAKVMLPLARGVQPRLVAKSCCAMGGPLWSRYRELLAMADIIPLRALMAPSDEDKCD
jgi:hypothetical protein